MRTKTILALFVTMMATTACQESKQEENEEAEVLDVPECVVTTPPDSLHLNPFYKNMCT